MNLVVLWHQQQLPNHLTGGGGGHFFSNSAFLKVAKTIVLHLFILEVLLR